MSVLLSILAAIVAVFVLLFIIVPVLEAINYVMFSMFIAFASAEKVVLSDLLYLPVWMLYTFFKRLWGSEQYVSEVSIGKWTYCPPFYLTRKR